MKRTKPRSAVAAPVDHLVDQQTDGLEPPTGVAGANDSTESEAVFRSDNGLLFGNTSLIDDALLREAIAGRFCV